MTQFNDPVNSAAIPLDTLVGRLLLFTVYEETDEIITVHGPTTAIRADVVVLDGDNAGETYDDALIFPKKLKSLLRKNVGGMMLLGRLEYGPKKPGLNAPYDLAVATPADRQVAQRWVDSHGHPAEVKAERAAEQSRPF